MRHPYCRYHVHTRSSQDQDQPIPDSQFSYHCTTQRCHNLIAQSLSDGPLCSPRHRASIDVNRTFFASAKNNFQAANLSGKKSPSPSESPRLEVLGSKIDRSPELRLRLAKEISRTSQSWCLEIQIGSGRSDLCLRIDGESHVLLCSVFCCCAHLPFRVWCCLPWVAFVRESQPLVS